MSIWKICFIWTVFGNGNETNRVNRMWGQNREVKLVLSESTFNQQMNCTWRWLESWERQHTITTKYYDEMTRAEFSLATTFLHSYIVYDGYVVAATAACFCTQSQHFTPYEWQRKSNFHFRFFFFSMWERRCLNLSLYVAYTHPPTLSFGNFRIRIRIQFAFI